MPEKAEYWGLTSNQFKRIKTKLALVANHLNVICQEAGYTRFETTNDWLGFTFSRKEKLQRNISLSLSDESRQLFTLNSSVWLMEKGMVRKAWSLEIEDLSLEKFEETEFKIVREAIAHANRISEEDLKDWPPRKK